MAALCLATGVHCATAAVVESPVVMPLAAARGRHANAQACALAAPAVWPATPIARREQIDRMQIAVRLCIEEPDFLAVLGALLLEDGEPAQALTWLERALLLDPGNLGAQADHVLALAELGEPEGLRALTRQWRARTDIPRGLRDKLYRPDSAQLTALPSVRFGQPVREGATWGTQVEISLLSGRESNLDRSPRLTELTLSIPEGPLVLPVVSEPREGSATLGTALLQAAYSPWQGTVLRSALNLNARRANSERTTDWNQAQWVVEWLQRGEGWRTQIDVAGSSIGGPLNEPYSLNRTSASAEVSIFECAARASYIEEKRTQSISATLNSTSTVAVVGLLCPLPRLPSWTFSVALNDGRDEPHSIERPGGRQRLGVTLIRLFGTVGIDTQIDLNQRTASVRDSEGYSILLDNDAVRRVTLRQLSVELAQPLRRFGWPGFTALAQWQSARQTSNLKLFTYRADSLYGGLRWTW